MLRRLISLAVLIWLLGFMWFAIVLPEPHGGSKTDSAVVFTGSGGRIARGLEAVRSGWTPKLLVSGVDKEVKPEEFAAEYDVSAATMKCCVTLEHESYDTRSNALEASRWLARHKFRSVRLITTDWHMRRAAHELNEAKPAGVSVTRDSVASKPSLQILFLEYHKLLARRLSHLWDG
jgi:uncharacterized SAM-binding protein YcdF (DUF218 family)